MAAGAVKVDCVVLVKKLSPRTTEDDLRDFFDEVGEVIRIRFGTDSIKGEPTSTAYCAFENNDEVVQALTLTGQRLRDQVVEVVEVPKRSLVMNLKGSRRVIRVTLIPGWFCKIPFGYPFLAATQDPRAGRWILKCGNMRLSVSTETTRIVPSH